MSPKTRVQRCVLYPGLDGGPIASTYNGSDTTIAAPVAGMTRLRSRLRTIQTDSGSVNTARPAVRYIWRYFDIWRSLSKEGRTTKDILQQ